MTRNSCLTTNGTVPSRTELEAPQAGRCSRWVITTDLLGKGIAGARRPLADSFHPLLPLPASRCDVDIRASTRPFLGGTKGDGGRKGPTRSKGPPCPPKQQRLGSTASSLPQDDHLPPRHPAGRRIKPSPPPCPTHPVILPGTIKSCVCCAPPATGCTGCTGSQIFTVSSTTAVRPPPRYARWR